TLSNSGCHASSASSSKINGKAGWWVRRNSTAARPSRPRPQIATRAEPSSPARIECCQKPLRNPVRMPGQGQLKKLGRIAILQYRKFLMQSPDDSIPAPLGIRTKMGHQRCALFDFADAFEWLVRAEPAQFGKPVGLRPVVEQIAAEDSDQLRFWNKGRHC